MPHNDGGRRRPGDRTDTGSQKITAAATNSNTDCTTNVDDHPALAADDAANFLRVFDWQQAILRTEGMFSADTLEDQHPYLLPLGNALGGIFMRLHRAGRIERVGYRPSSRPSRAGGIVTIWQRVR